MKKIIIVLSILLSSCTANMGDLRKRTLIITDANIPSMKENSSVYIARSFYGGTYTDAIKFTDDIGKYKVGDTIKIVKR
jgi:hypothetical protein